MHENLSSCDTRQIAVNVDTGSSGSGSATVSFAGVVNTAQQIKGCVRSIDPMPAKSSGIDRTKIQTLQFVMGKVSAAEAEEPFCEVPIVFYSTHDFIGGDSTILASIC